MIRRSALFLLLAFIVIKTCAQSDRSYRSQLKKFSPEELQSDLRLLKSILEANHPSIYWYTPPAAIDSLFVQTFAGIKDSMNELDFKNRVAAYISMIRCGHTSVRSSRHYSKNSVKDRFPLFPLNIKLWQDSMVVLNNFQPRDSLISRGTRLLTINGRDARFFIDFFSQYISGDGYGKQFASQLVSGNFGAFYKNILGLDSSYEVSFINRQGAVEMATLKNILPADLTPEKNQLTKNVPQLSRKETRRLQLAQKRSLQFDSSGTTAWMRLGSFSGSGTGRFIRNSFKKINRAGIQHLIIDLRTNGGGKVSNSTLLTRYLSDHEFRVADTVVRNSSKIYYKKYIQQAWFYQLGLLFSGRQQQDGRFHFKRFETKTWAPISKHHFNGSVFLIQGGYSFSATTLVLGELKGQKNIRLLGEESGGAYYGNSAMMIPTITLPHSKIRVSLPLFRLVANSRRPKGLGIIPDIPVPPSSDAIRKGIDPKIEKIKSLIAGEEK